MQVHELGNTAILSNVEAYAELAWYECVELAQKTLPILVAGDRIVTGDEIIPKLENIFSLTKTE